MRTYDLVSARLLLRAALASLLLASTPSCAAQAAPTAQRLGAQAGTNTPSLVAGFAGERALVAWNAAGVWLAVFAPDGTAAPAVHVPDLEFVRAIVSTPDGALLIEGPRYVKVGADGRLGPTVVLREHPAMGTQAFTLEPDGIAAVVAEPAETTTLVYRRYLFDGTPVGPALGLGAGPFVVSLGMVRRANGEHTVAWIELGETSKVMVTTVDAAGRAASAPLTVYSTAPGGAANGCSVAATPDGNALVGWADSSPGPWTVFTIKVGPTGALGSAVRVSHSEGDATNATVFSDGQRNGVAWLSGIHWGALSVRGNGAISLSEVGRDGERTFAPGGALTAYAVAARGDRILTASAVREGDAYAFYGAFVSRAAPAP